MSAQVERSKLERARATPSAKRVGEAAAVPFAEELALSLSLDAAMLAWQRKGLLGFFVPTGEWAQILAAATAGARSDELIFPGVRESRLAIFRGLPLAEYLRQLGVNVPHRIEPRQRPRRPNRTKPRGRKAKGANPARYANFAASQ